MCIRSRPSTGTASRQGVDHWRNWLPATYYCTHALAPVMFITDTCPAKVNGFVIPHAADDPVAQRRPVRHDAASMIAVRMDNGAVVKLLQVYLRGESIWVRIHGSRGQMENLRQGDAGWSGCAASSITRSAPARKR